MFDTFFSDAQAHQAQQPLEMKPDRKHDELILPPYARGRRKSKYYTRPVFKEPCTEPRVPEKKSSHLHPQSQNIINRHTAIIDQLRIQPPRPQWDETDDASVIQPRSRTSYRLKTIVGMQSRELGFRNTQSTRGLEGRLLKENHRQTECFDSSASVATCSNLDRLEAKRLTMRQDYLFQRKPSDMSSIRREVTKLAGVDVTPSPMWGTPRSCHEGDNRDESETDENDMDESSVRTDQALKQKDDPLGGFLSMLTDVPSIQSVISDIKSWRFS